MAQFILFVSFLYFITFTTLDTCSATNFSALIVFGDSTVDTGNNNYILTVFKANHAPYGINFAGQTPTGRFSDGKLVPDMLVSDLGIGELSPPFLSPTLSEDDIRRGANFASAGSGFDEVTTAFSGVIPLSRQIDMFKSYIARLKGIVGEQEASRTVSEALIMISAASNDLAISFYDNLARSIQFTISQYHDFLIEKIESFIKDVYDLGGRRFVMWGISPIGCGPIQMTIKFRGPLDRTCVENEDADTISFNTKLQKLLTQLQQTLPNSKFAYNEMYDSAMDMFQNPEKYGFVETKRGCCGSGYVEAGALCNSLTPTCPDPSKFMFFDSVHPSEAVYRIVTKNIIEKCVPRLI